MKKSEQWCKHSKLLSVFSYSLVLILSSTPSQAGVLSNVVTEQDEYGELQIRLDLDSENFNYKSFTTKSPERLIVDLMDTSLQLEEKKREIQTSPVKSYMALESSGRSRVIFHLDGSKNPSLEKDGTGLLIAFNESAVLPKPNLTSSSSGEGGPSTVLPGLVKEENQVNETVALKTLPGPGVTDVDFRRNKLGAGLMQLQLANSKIMTDIKQRGSRVELTVHDAQLPSRLARKLDVTDFGTPVNMISLKQNGESIFIELETTGEYELLSYQADDKFTIEIQPFTVAQKELKARENKQYLGEKLSLNFQDIEVRSVLQLIADFTGNNMVASDSVAGNVTLRLLNVPWDQALDIILSTKGLGMKKTGNVIMVAPAAEITAQERLALEATQQVSELAPLRSAFIPINFAKASAIAALLKGEETSLLSERGNVSIDERTNTLLVQDTASKIQEVREIIAEIDTPVRQVEIDTRIVSATKTFKEELGVKWGSTGKVNIDNARIGIGQNIPDANTLSEGGTVGTAPADRLNVNLGVLSPTSQVALSFARLGKDALLDLELSAAASDNLARNIASPKLITADQKQAVIRQGQQVPYLQASSSGATSVSFRNAVLELSVTPQITPDNHVIMDINVKQDSLSTATVTTTKLPVLNTKEVLTQVLVDNGETVVLGGIYTRDETDDENKVPFFGDLPMVSYLFKNTSKTDTRKELLIFVTPRIVLEESRL